MMPLLCACVARGNASGEPESGATTSRRVRDLTDTLLKVGAELQRHGSDGDGDLTEVAALASDFMVQERVPSAACAAPHIRIRLGMGRPPSLEPIVGAYQPWEQAATWNTSGTPPHVSGAMIPPLANGSMHESPQCLQYFLGG